METEKARNRPSWLIRVLFAVLVSVVIAAILIPEWLRERMLYSELGALGVIANRVALHRDAHRLEEGEIPHAKVLEMSGPISEDGYPLFDADGEIQDRWGHRVTFRRQGKNIFWQSHGQD